MFNAETGHASIQPYDPAGTSHGPPRIWQQPSVSSCDAWRDGPVSQEARPPTDSAGAAAEPQPAVSRQQRTQWVSYLRGPQLIGHQSLAANICSK